MTYFPPIAIIIVTWNGWKDTLECLESIYQNLYEKYYIILVDNNSDNDFFAKFYDYVNGDLEVESNFVSYSEINKPINVFEYSRNECENSPEIPSNLYDLPSYKKLIIIKNEKNYGFAEGSNIGMRFAIKFLKSDYILLQNNDTVVDKEFLIELVNAARMDNNIGCVGPLIFDYCNPSKSTWIAREKLNLWLGNTDIPRFSKKNGALCTVGCTEGSCMLLKREILEKVGLLDTDYFLYWEEIDLCARMNKAGFKILHCPKAIIWHKYGSSGNIHIREYYKGKNRFLYMKKNASRLQMITFIIFFFLFYFWARMVFLIIKGDVSACTSFYTGVMNGLVLIFRN